MKTHWFSNSTLLLLLPLLLIVCWLFSARDVITAQRRTFGGQPCSPSSFFGTWSTPNHDGSLQIVGSGGGASGTVMSNGSTLKKMQGSINGYTMTGSWYDYVPEGGRGGNFTAKLDPGNGRIDVTFYVNGSPVEYGVWFCGSAPTPPPPTYTPTPDLTPTPTPEPTATPIRDDQDQDNFQTFDSLTPEQQVAVLVRRGPRQRVQYEADDFAMRILVKNGAPLIIDYGLDSNRPANLTVEIPNGKPVLALLEPGPRVTFAVPLRVRSRDPVVAKLTINASEREEGTGLQLFGVSVGERGRQALLKADHDIRPASNSFSKNTIEGFSLFAPQRDALSLQIQVDLPATLKAKQKPEQKIVFSCTSGADFSDGRWEWWRVEGLNWTKVWQHGTRSLSRNQKISEDWNGIITSRKLVSAGAHALEITAWQRSGDDRDSIVVWAQSRLTVIE